MNMFNKNKLILALISTFVFFAGIWVTFRSKPTDENQLVIGMMSGWAPFMTINKDGEFEGFDVDVAQEIAQKMGKKLVIKDFGALATLMIALQQNKIDFAMSGLDITTKRMETMDMIPYCGQEVKSVFLLFWQNIPTGVTTAQDLQKLPAPVVCVEPGSMQADYLNSLKFITPKSMSKLEEMVLDIKYGKSTAMLVEPQMVKRLIRQNAELKPLEIILPQEFKIFGTGIAFVKNRPMKERVKKIIEEIRSQGILARLEQKWGMESGE